MVGDLDREVRRHGCRLDPDLAARAHYDLERDRRPLQTLGIQLVLAELGGRDDVEAGRVIAHAGNLEGVQSDDATAVLLEVEEAVGDDERYLVP